MALIKRKHLPIVAIACTMVLTHMLALTVVQTYPQEYRAFGSDTNNPITPLIYIGFIILFTAGLLLVMKYTEGNFLQYAILGVVGLTLFYVFYPVLFHLMYPLLIIIPFDLAFVLSVPLAILLTYLLYKKPEWYVIDSIGAVMGAGIAGIFGMSFGILPVFILLIVLALYDFISVYKTKHMLTLASGVMKQKLPVMMVMPNKKNYSFSEKKDPMGDRQKKSQSDKGGRDAMFVGLGDVIIPGILPVSASLYLPKIIVSGFYAPLVVALGSMAGAIVGMLILLHFVLKGKAHAGLPLLNSGAILGYMISYYIMYQDLMFGIQLPW